jgi:hypothetical protein
LIPAIRGRAYGRSARLTAERRWLPLLRDESLSFSKRAWLAKAAGFNLQNC